MQHNHKQQQHQHQGLSADTSVWRRSNKQAGGQRRGQAAAGQGRAGHAAGALGRAAADNEPAWHIPNCAPPPGTTEGLPAIILNETQFCLPPPPPPPFGCLCPSGKYLPALSAPPPALPCLPKAVAGGCALRRLLAAQLARPAKARLLLLLLLFDLAGGRGGGAGGCISHVAAVIVIGLPQQTGTARPPPAASWPGGGEGQEAAAAGGDHWRATHEQKAWPFPSIVL